MIIETIRIYDIKPCDEMDRADLIHCLATLAKICDDSLSADVVITTEKKDFITVRITTVDSP